MRCFIAIEIPGEVKGSISDLIERGRGKAKKAKGIAWVPAGNLHLTLKFLGNVSDDLVPEIVRLLSDICRNHGPFTVTVRGTGAFPGLRRPRVLWVGMDAPEELILLQRDIEKAMSGLGFAPEERNFSPHLTVARVRDPRGIDPVVEEFSTFQDRFFGTIDIEKILLMRSELKPGGAEYSRVADFKLKDTS